MKLKFLYLTILLLSLGVCSCEKDDDTNNEEQITNKLIGTWKCETTDSWCQFIFNADLTGSRTDSDGENDDFTYTFTSDKVNFTSGFPTGEHAYTITNDNELTLFNDKFIKQ